MDQKTKTLLEQVQIKQNEVNLHLSKNRPFLAQMALTDIDRLLIQIEIHLDKPKRQRERTSGFERDIA